MKNLKSNRGHELAPADTNDFETTPVITFPDASSNPISGEFSDVIRELVQASKLPGEVTVDDKDENNLGFKEELFIQQDPPEQPLEPVQVRISDANSIFESESAGFIITLSRASDVPVTVRFETADGFAVSGLDYNERTGSVTFAPGQTTITLNIESLDDELNEDSEHFFVRLTGADGAIVVDSQGRGEIRDNDDIPKVSISDAESVEEGNEAFFTISLSQIYAIIFTLLFFHVFTIFIV